MRLVILGLSITSSWGNGHATTFRSLVRELSTRGHDVLFLEREVPWYASQRDMPMPPWGRLALYTSLPALIAHHASDIRDADAVIIGSYVPDGVAVAEFVFRTARGPVAFYDIDTPVTLAKLQRGDHEYLAPQHIPRFDLYLSFTGGPTLDLLEQTYRAQRARPLYCSVDTSAYFPARVGDAWDLGYMGTWSADRQPTVDALLVEPAMQLPDHRFVVAGPMYPDAIRWPQNVQRFEHLAPGAHCAFYNAQRFTLNVTRADMITAGWSPSVRLFEAAACGTPIISDWWRGLEEFFRDGEEIIVARDSSRVRQVLRCMPDAERHAMGDAARSRVLAAHTSRHRALELEGYLHELLGTVATPDGAACVS